MRCRGKGPTPCDIMLVAECPGYEESLVGYPLAEKGASGKEVRRYMSGEDLPALDDIFRTNLYREYVHAKYEYTEKDLKRDEPELREEFNRVLPRLVVTLGRHATRFFLGNVDMEDVHAIPWSTSFEQRHIVVFPIFHPAAEFHNPEIQAYVAYGFQQLALIDSLTPRVLFDDPYAGKEEYEYTDGAISSQELSCDTEGTLQRPWSIQYSVLCGTARLAHYGTSAARSCCRAVLRARRLTFHHATHDIAILERCFDELGLVYPRDWIDGRFDDTMCMAYLLQIEPQGLKSLAVRYCGMAMQSYQEVLGDANDRLACDYLVSTLDVCEYAYRQQREAAYDLAVDAGRRLRVMPKLPKTRVHRALERCFRSTRARALWLDQDEDIHVEVHKLGGELPEATLSHVPAAKALIYACRDADATGRLKPLLFQRIQAMGLEDLYHLELATYPLAVRMMRVGMKPDLPHFAVLSNALDLELKDLQCQLERVTDTKDLNANSGDQVAFYLFEQLGLPGGKRTEKGRYSTNDRILEALEHRYGLYHPGLTFIRSFRELYKLKNTFVDRIPDYVHRFPFDGRVHCDIKLTRTVTGRKATANPNLMAQPERGRFAKDFKAGWVAEPGHVVGNWDQSQIELRGLAHLSQDPVLVGVYRGERRNRDGSPIDLHANLAQRIFGGDVRDYADNCTQRVAAKEINFGLPMGMQAYGLALALQKDGLDIDEDDAQRWLDDTMALYAEVPRYQKRMVMEARRQGYVRCASGRLRYIGGIHSRNEWVRAEAERFAFATPIQEIAQLIMKHAEAAIWKDIIVPYATRAYVEPLLQVHDAIKLEVTEGLQDEIHRGMVQAMTKAPLEAGMAFSVPLAVEGKWGTNFRDMTKFSESIS